MCRFSCVRGTKAGVVNRTLLLTEKEQTVELGEPADWLVVNAGAHGFYRVRYSARTAYGTAPGYVWLT